MSEQRTDQPEAKRRGPGFPSMTLHDAVEAIVIAGRNGPEHSEDAFATYLGHKTANSGAFRAKLASMRDWGLLARGNRDRVALSGLAQELVLAAPEYTSQQLLAAFESCRVFGMLYNDSAKNMPTDLSRLRTQVLMRYGVAKDQVDRFVASFVQSAAFAGLAQTDGTTVTLFNREATVGGGYDVGGDVDLAPELTAGQQPIAAPHAQESPVASSAHAAIPTALRQQWPIDGGEIEFVIRTAEALPPRIYVLVAEMAQVAEKMKAMLVGPAFEPRTADPAAADRPSKAQDD
ncbi:hypothetical protein CELL_02272 [Cellulomonas sp. T2.31MG-18]|uniref:hypothetical protein n=1 Tax=Cellulomonas sp. T2.31MG-18 TaxID=3157619 RepID=UPI0035F037FD